MNPRKRKAIYERLAVDNPYPTTELNFSSSFQLLIAVVLSAQSTDVSVNKATRKLFRVAATPKDILALGENGLKHHIRTIGLFNGKAKNIHRACAILMEQHGGEVPQDRKALEALPGVGRKTANVILNTAFGQPTIAVDTHIFRISNRIGLAPGKNVDEVEQKPINEMLNIWEGENLRLTRMDISTDMKIKLFGATTEHILQKTTVDSTEDVEDEFYSSEQKTVSNKQGDNIWESKLQFKYSTNWKYTDEEWDYKFSLKTINSINLSKNWTLSYMADFNVKEREMTYHSFRIYRPLHCWEFSFNYWPRGGSAGFSLQINIKNPDLQDIKLTSKDGKRGFGGF